MHVYITKVVIDGTTCPLNVSYELQPTMDVPATPAGNSRMSAWVGSLQMGTPNQTVSFPGTLHDHEPEPTIRTCTHRTLHFSRTIHVEPRIAGVMACRHSRVFDTVVHGEKCSRRWIL